MDTNLNEFSTGENPKDIPPVQNESLGDEDIFFQIVETKTAEGTKPNDNPSTRSEPPRAKDNAPLEYDWAEYANLSYDEQKTKLLKDYTNGLLTMEQFNAKRAALERLNHKRRKPSSFLENRPVIIGVACSVIICALLAAWYAYSTKTPQTVAVTPPRVSGSSTAAMSDEDFIQLCARGTAQDIETAIENGADANSRRGDGWTALMEAARYNPNLEVVSTLARNGADVNATYNNGQTALMTVANHNSNPEVISVLAKNGADMNAKFSDGRTALMIAVGKSSNPEIVSALVNSGADINVKDSYGDEAITYLSANVKLRDNKSLQQLLTGTSARSRTKARSSNSSGSTYQAIYDEYSAKLRSATPRLIREYQSEAARNRRGIEGLAEISNAKVQILAGISTEGTSQMAEIALQSGMGSYMDWAMKLSGVYMEEAGKITGAYMSSAMGSIFK